MPLASESDMKSIAHSMFGYKGTTMGFLLRQKDSLIIEVSLIANCCHNFLGEAEVIDSDVLSLSYVSYGSFCSCSCAFKLRFILDTKMEKHYQILQRVIINGSLIFAEITNN